LVDIATSVDIALVDIATFGMQNVGREMIIHPLSQVVVTPVFFRHLLESVSYYYY